MGCSCYKTQVLFDTCTDVITSFSLLKNVIFLTRTANRILSIRRITQERVAPIVKEIEANGGQFIYNAKAKEPIMVDGKVVGLKAASGKDVLAVNAKASIVCTGGFIGSTKMQKKYLNTSVLALGNTSSDGAGIELAHKAGSVDDRIFAVLGNECGAVAPTTTGWPFTEQWTNKNEHCGYWLFGGLYTDSNGERFINEEQVARFPLAIGGEALVRQGRAYVDASLRALNENNEPIQGLYMAGVDAGSMYSMPYYDNPGLLCGSGTGFRRSGSQRDPCNAGCLMFLG